MDNALPKVSVIIPVYNAEKTLPRALQSVKGQTWPGNFEILIVDDGSTDSSALVAKNFIADNPHMNCQLLSQENNGVSAARNTGLKAATSGYITLLDADDEWLPEKTEKQIKLLQDESAGIDFLVTLWNDEKVQWPYSVNSRTGLAEITLQKLLLKITGQTSTAMFKRKVLDNTGYFDEAQRYSEDANFWLRATAHNRLFLLPEKLVIAGSGKRSFGESGLSANLAEMEKGIQKNIRELRQNKRLSALQYFLYFAFSKFKYALRPLRAKL